MSQGHHESSKESVKGKYGQFYGLEDPEDAKLSTSDEGVDDHGETVLSTMMPEMRLTIESGYCLAFRE
jgi:hypothetical protein